MLDHTQIHTTGTGSHHLLARRLMQLADDTNRVGLHREALALATFATSVLEGRPLAVRDA